MFANKQLNELLQIFEKKTLESNFKRDRGSSRQDAEQVYELLKKEARISELKLNGSIN